MTHPELTIGELQGKPRTIIFNIEDKTVLTIERDRIFAGDGVDVDEAAKEIFKALEYILKDAFGTDGS